MIGWKQKREVIAILDEIASCALIEKIYPTFIAKKSGYPLSEVFDILVEFVKEEMLDLEWEVRCTEYGCSRTLKILKELPESEETIDCICGEDVEITTDNVFPVFVIPYDYRQHIISENKNPKKKEKFKTSIGEISKPNSGVSLKDIANEKNIKLPDWIPVKEAGNIIINNIHATQCYVKGQGDNRMRDNFSGVSINTENSAVNLGNDNKIEDFAVNRFDKLTEIFLNELNKNKCAECEEIKEKVIKISEHLKLEKEDRSYIEYLKDGVKTLFNGVTKSTELIAAYTAWSGFLG